MPCLQRWLKFDYGWVITPPLFYMDVIAYPHPDYDAG